MQTKEQRSHAEEAYRSGAAYIREGRCAEAFAELRRAEDLFRRMDAAGRPFNMTLENGISGLANVLYLLGTCQRKQGDLAAAITSFETSMINGRFERKLPYRSFRRLVEAELADCYEKMLTEAGRGTAPSAPEGEPPIDLSYRFPFSLPPDLIPLARLYELAPERCPQYRPFYEQARSRDTELRRASRKADDTTLRTISIGVWSVLAAIWLAYGIVVVRNLVYP